MKIQAAMTHNDLTEVLGRVREISMEKDLPLNQMVIVIEGDVPGYNVVRKTIALTDVTLRYVQKEE